MEKLTIIETIVVLSIVAVALLYVLWRVFKTARGKGDCGCGHGNHCKCKNNVAKKY